MIELVEVPGLDHPGARLDRMTPTVRLGAVMAAISFARTVALLGTVLLFLALSGALTAGRTWLLLVVLVVTASLRAALTVRYAVRRDRLDQQHLA